MGGTYLWINLKNGLTILSTISLNLLVMGRKYGRNTLKIMSNMIFVMQLV
jgi:hypothetical protein